jgi:16S rRNA (adenine1518-N6/adenine1519-N6)-dimethyltransferase
MPVNQRPLDVPALLRSYNLHPDKRLGQNFLVDERALDDIIEAGAPESEDIVLEVGPGLGGLTRKLASRATHVIAVELDVDLIPPLNEVISGYSNITVIQGDILSLDIANLIETAWKKSTHGQLAKPEYLVIANIPYYMTSILIRYLLENNLPPVRMVLTLQNEVAERICNQSGKMSLLALSVQIYGSPQIFGRIPASSFYPAPQVDSAILRVVRYAQPRIPAILLPLTFRLAKAGFSQKRKILRNSISAGMHWNTDDTELCLLDAGIDPLRRAETLSLEEWKGLAQSVNDHMIP